MPINVPSMSKIITILVLQDKFGRYPFGKAKTYNADDLKIVGEYLLFLDADQYDPTCVNTRSAVMGSQGDGSIGVNAPAAAPYTLCLRLKFKDEWIFAYVIRTQLEDLKQGCCITGTKPASVTLAAPATATAGVAFALTATPTAGDSAVSKVEFYQLDTKLGEVASPGPYTYNQTLVAGTYWFVARVTDANGNHGWSNPIQVVVS